MTQTCPMIGDFARCTAREACALLGISFNTLKKAVRERRIVPNHYSTGIPYYPGREIKRFWSER